MSKILDENEQQKPNLIQQRAGQVSDLVLANAIYIAILMLLVLVAVVYFLFNSSERFSFSLLFRSEQSLRTFVTAMFALFGFVWALWAMFRYASLLSKYKKSPNPETLELAMQQRRIFTGIITLIFCISQSETILTTMAHLSRF